MLRGWPPRRPRQRGVLVHYQELGLGAAAGQAHDAIPGMPPRRAGACGVHLAGVFHSGDVGGPAGRRGVLAATLVDVGAVQARRVDPDADLTRPGNRVGPLGERKHFRPAGAGVDDRTHDSGERSTVNSQQSTCITRGGVPWTPASPRSPRRSGSTPGSSATVSTAWPTSRRECARRTPPTAPRTSPRTWSNRVTTSSPTWA